MMAFVLAALLTTAVYTSYVYCQSPDTQLECNMAEERFNQSVLCKVTYDDIVGVRGCTFGRDATLCEGECGERAQMISCLCQDENLITNNIGRLCNCESNITCPPLVSPPRETSPPPIGSDNCSKAVNAFKNECGVAYSTLIRFSNNSCSTCCSALCETPECNKLAKNVSCHCSEMSEGYQIIGNINSLCKCSTEHCGSSANDILLLPWILMLSLATWWIS